MIDRNAVLQARVAERRLDHAQRAVAELGHRIRLGQARRHIRPIADIERGRARAARDGRHLQFELSRARAALGRREIENVGDVVDVAVPAIGVESPCDAGAQFAFVAGGVIGQLPGLSTAAVERFAEDVAAFGRAHDGFGQPAVVPMRPFDREAEQHPIPLQRIARPVHADERIVPNVSQFGLERVAVFNLDG